MARWEEGALAHEGQDAGLQGEGLIPDENEMLRVSGETEGGLDERDFEAELARRFAEDGRSAAPDRRPRWEKQASDAGEGMRAEGWGELLEGDIYALPREEKVMPSAEPSKDLTRDDVMLTETVFVPPVARPAERARGPEPPYEAPPQPIPGEGELPEPGVERPPLEEIPAEQREEWLTRIGEERLRQLHEEIGQLYDQAAEQLGSQRELLGEVLDQLREARAILVERPEYFAEAEYRVQQVQAVLTRVARSREWGARYGPRILLYEAIWLALLLGTFIVASVFSDPMTEWLARVSGRAVSSTLVSQAIPFLSTLLWGGIGGVVSALWSLHWHISDQLDFDKDYVMWYLEQPLLGIVLGGIVYLIMGTGFLVLQTDLTVESANLGARLLPSTLAFVGGFRQNLVYSLIDKIVQLINPRQG
ncbi:MAG TPA: hypothetical protein G4O02_06875 [Caldilineae bacterium]|nr:hypothetical protein [Caldilineae bacterium]